MNKYPHLLSPLKVNKLMLKNRIVASPMGIMPGHVIISSTNYGNMSAYDKAAGGAAVVHLSGASMGGDEGMFAKYHRDALREDIYVGKQAGAAVSLELAFHSMPINVGEMVVYGPIDGVRYDGAKMKMLMPDTMEEFNNNFAAVAVKARDFGFDMITVHFAHDSLCGQFISPYFNTRTDEYGGSLENRIRFPKEAIKTVREAVGPDFPIHMRISRHLGVPESYEESDILYFLKEIDEYIDLVSVSCGMDCYYEANQYSAPTIFQENNYNVDFAKTLKENLTHTKIAVVGGITSPDDMEEIIASGKADAVMIGRQLLADPYFPNKLIAGKEDDVVPCLRCLYCYHISTEHTNVVCSVNPRFRRESRVPVKLPKTESPKHVVVIGGGPGGLKAAITANGKGHKVTLFEKSDRLGGMINISDYGNYKGDLKRYRNYLLTQIEKSDVDVKLNTEATPEAVKALNPDAVIIAVGAEPIVPNIPGIEYATQVVDAIPSMDEVKGSVAVIGGGTVGCEFGLELAEAGNDVHVIEMTNKISAQSNWLYMMALETKIENTPSLHIRTETTCKEIKENGVVVVKDGKEEFIEAEHVFVSVGLKSKTDLAHSFYGITPVTAMVGDCNRPAKVLEATNEAYFIAASIE